MKNKIILAGAAATMALLATGCNQAESKLVCTQTTSGVDIEFNVGFKGKTIETMDFNYDMDLSAYSDMQIEAVGKQDFCTTVKNAMSEYKDAFTDCNQNVEDKHLKVSSTLDVDKIATTTLSKMTSPEKAKKELEAEGYTCTINK